VTTTTKHRRRLNLGSSGLTSKKPKVVTVTAIPHIPNTANIIAMLVGKLKDHSKYVWSAIEETQQEMMSSDAEHITKI